MDSIMMLFVGLVAGIIIGIIARMMYAKGSVKSAEKTAEIMLKEAKAVAESKKKEGLLEVKDKMEHMRRDFEHETKDRRQELQALEKRINHDNSRHHTKAEGSSKCGCQRVQSLDEPR